MSSIFAKSAKTNAGRPNAGPESHPTKGPCAVKETLRRIDRSLLRADSPNLIEQRLRRDGTAEESFQQLGRIEFFAKA